MKNFIVIIKKSVISLGSESAASNKILKCALAVAVVFVLHLVTAENSMAANLEKSIQKTFEKLSDDYIRIYPVKSTKKGLIVLRFNELSKGAKSKGLGNTVREIFSRRAVTSQVFYLIDRDSLDASIKELQLSMTGLVSPERIIKAGMISSASVFLAGTISELRDMFIISVKLIDAETGRVLTQETVELDQNELIKMKKEMTFAYMAEHGIGINFQYSMGFIHSPAAYTLNYADVFMNYRPYLWLNFKLGMTSLNLEFKDKKNIQAQSIFPTLPGSEDPIKYTEGDMNEISPYVGVDFNYTPSEKFTVAFGISFNYFKEPILTQHYSPLYYDNGSGTEKGGVFDVIQEMQPLYIFRLEVKPQYFITPRMTVGLYFAFILSSKFKVYKSLINNEYSGFISQDSGTSQHEIEMQEKYYNIPLSVLADGKNANDVNFNLSWATGLSFNFYF